MNGEGNAGRSRPRERMSLRSVSIVTAILMVSVGFSGSTRSDAPESTSFDADIYVKDVNGNNLDGARVYVNDVYIKDTYFEWSKWTFLAHIEGLQVGDTLTARYDYVHEFDGSRPNKGRLHLEGSQEITTTDDQEIVVKGLMSLELVVSFENGWVPSTNELKDAVQNLRDTSTMLWDVTDGHVEIGKITLYDDGQMWNDADIRIYQDIDQMEQDSGKRIPNAHYKGLFHANRYTFLPGVQSHQTVVHELGHYAFDLYDEYKDEDGKDYSDCGGQGPPGFMNNGWLYDEMTTAADYEAFDPPGDCRNTEHWGKKTESTWETTRKTLRFDGTGWWVWPSPDWVDWVEVPDEAADGPFDDVGNEMELELHSSTRFQIQVEPERTMYLPGETANVDITFMNVGPIPVDFTLGVTFRHEETGYYDSNVGVVQDWDQRLSPGGSFTFDVSWDIPVTVDDGQYQIAVNAWWDPYNDDHIYDDNIEYEDIFVVSDKAGIIPPAPMRSQNYDVNVVIESPFSGTIAVTIDESLDETILPPGMSIPDLNLFSLEDPHWEETIQVSIDKNVVAYRQRHSWDWLSETAKLESELTKLSSIIANMFKVPLLGGTLTAVEMTLKMREAGLAVYELKFDYLIETDSPAIDPIAPMSATVVVPPEKMVAFAAYLKSSIVSSVLTEFGFVTLKVAPYVPFPGNLIALAIAAGLFASEAYTHIQAKRSWEYAIDPDPNYQEVARPEFCLPDELEDLEDSSAKTLAKELADLLGYLTALYKTLGKYDAAEDDMAGQYMQLQLGWAQTYSDLVSAKLESVNNQLQIVQNDVTGILNEARAQGVDVDAILEDTASFKQHIDDYGLVFQGISDPDIEPTILGKCGNIWDTENIEDALIILDDDYYKDVFRSISLFADLGSDFRGLRGSIGRNIEETFPVYPPVADAGSDQVVYEGETAYFDASGSFVINGEIISYEWDFDGDGAYDYSSTEPTASFVYYDNTIVTVSVKVTARIPKPVVEEDGTISFEYEYLTSTDILTVTVLNRDPTARIDAAYMYVDFTLRVAGEKWHNVYWDLYETDWPFDGGDWENPGRRIAHLEVERYPGDPDMQSDTVYDKYIDMEKIYYFVATYNPYEDDNPISGQLWGANPVWIDLTFEDGSTERIHHTFNVQQSLVRDSEHWVHVEPWYIDLSPWFVGHVVTFEASTFDPGTDDVTFVWDWGDGTPTEAFLFTYRPSGALDPYPSPYDRDEGTYPVNIARAKFYHTYMYEGDFVAELTVVDDDDGSNEDTLEIDAIHTQHIYPVK